MIRDNFLKKITLEDAIIEQHRLVDCICDVFKDNQFLSMGTLGINSLDDSSSITRKVEKVLANFFNAEDAVIVRGAGTGAIQEALFSVFEYNRNLLIHDGPVYSTTCVNFEKLSIKVNKIDFNNLNQGKQIRELLDSVNAIYIQHTRQSVSDVYDLKSLISILKNNCNHPIIVDDNYATFRVPKIGVELNADLSCFSLFKLSGPIGLGCVVGKKIYIEKIKQTQISGGTKIQDFEALDALRSLGNVHTALAIQGNTVDNLYFQLKQNRILGVKDVYRVNMQSYVLLIEFTCPIADKIILESKKLGAVNVPVGSESRFEIVPLFYTPSRAFLNSHPKLKNRCIRVNPFRSGTDTIIKILREAINNVFIKLDE